MGTDPISLQLAVERLHARYAHALDAGKLEEWPQFFTENAATASPTAENEERGLPLSVLYAEGRAMMRDRIQSLRPRQHLRAAALPAHDLVGAG
jgi:3-phenylpropionate/cinnamic acid dioxygenase small subunit